MTSYCIEHDGNDEVSSVGYGCSWGTGAGIGNAGYRKGVEIENYMNVLTYEGEELDIKNIENEDKLIENAVNFAVKGIEEKATELEGTDMTQQGIELEMMCYENSAEK